MLNKWNLKVGEFASREESRYTLKAIQVSKDATVATDGHRLVWVSTERSTAASFPQIDHAPSAQDDYPTFLLPTDAAAAIAKAIPKKSTLPILLTAGVAVIDGQPVVMATDLATPQVFRPTPPSGTFPNWEAVMPAKSAEPIATITLNAAHLAQLAKFAAEFTSPANSRNHSAHALRITVYGADKAVRFDAYNRDTDQGMTSLIMPIRDAGTLRNVFGYVAPVDEVDEAEADAADANAAKVDVA